MTPPTDARRIDAHDKMLRAAWDAPGNPDICLACGKVGSHTVPFPFRVLLESVPLRHPPKCKECGAEMPWQVRRDYSKGITPTETER